MSKFFAELKRRHMYRVAAAYAVVAWLLIQLVNNMTPALRLPEWASTFVVVLLAVGFPVALLFCWIQHLAPADGANPPAKTAKLDWLLIGALVLVIALLSYQQLALSPGATPAQQTASVAVGSSPIQSGGISIAVLPLVNLSADQEQEFFSDGMTDEITLALAKIRDLRVVGRSSAFQFKGQNRDLRAIGQALAARYLIDGSVRKEGNRLRITAQLIEAGNGVNVWTESYDRELISVFAIQADIAQAIAGALQVPLGLNQGATLVSSRTSDQESYEQYLRARALFRARSVSESIALLEQVVARSPGFAPAWGLLSRAYAYAPFYGPEVRSGSLEDARQLVQSAYGKAERAAREAIRLDPENADGHQILADIQSDRGNLVAAEELYKQALALDPNEPEVLHEYSNLLRHAGRVRESLSMRENIRTLDPFVPVYNVMSAVFLQSSGQRQASIPILEAIPAEAAGGFFRNVFLARAYAAEGRYAEAADTLLRISGSQVSRKSVEDAARLLRGAPAAAGAPETLPRLEGDLGFVYAHVGAPDRVLEDFERSVEIRYFATSGPATLIWSPELGHLRKTERFKAMVRNAGLVEYWRARGWPELCRPVGTDDFVCD